MSAFTWQVDGHAILFRLGTKYYKPWDSPLRAWVWAVEGGYRAAISNGQLVKISSATPYARQQAALDSVAAFFKRRAAA